MDIFALTETEFFRKLTDGENDNLHIASCATPQNAKATL